VYRISILFSRFNSQSHVSGSAETKKKKSFSRISKICENIYDIFHQSMHLISLSPPFFFTIFAPWNILKQIKSKQRISDRRRRTELEFM